MDKAKAGEQRLIENQKIHPQKGKKNLKQEELKLHSQKMLSFIKEVSTRRKKGWCTKALADIDEFINSIDDYIECITKLGLFPTIQGLCLYLDVSESTFYAIENLNDERSDVIKKYRLYITEFFNQSGLAQSTNPVFSIYYGKSVLGQSDQVPLDVNVHMDNKPTFEPDKIESIIELTPDDYKDV